MTHKTNWMISLLALGFLALTFPIMAQDGPGPDAGPDFQTWLGRLKDDALARGISSDVLEAAFNGLEPNPRVIELDRSQPEFTQTFWTYLDQRVSDTRIEQGRRLLAEHKDLLRNIEQEYGVQGRFLVAFWGLETNFGRYLGAFPVVQSLATLAHDPRRSDFFRSELFDALTILNQGHITAGDMMGSWAGAMGQPQFMPSTFVRYAVDETGDGKKDIWGTLPDVFASAANYLGKLGWDNSKTWGREVKLPDGFNAALAGLSTKKDLSEWQALGVRKIDGTALPGVKLNASLLLPAGLSGPAFLVYPNFEAILNWNRSDLYAISVGHLADRLIGLGPLKSPRIEEKPLSRSDIETAQRLLTELGFDTEGIDGQVGPRTRAAVRAFQMDQGLPADSYLSSNILETLKKRAKTEGESQASP